MKLSLIEKSSDLHDKRERKTPIVAQADFISGGQQIGLILAGLAIDIGICEYAGRATLTKRQLEEVSDLF